ncbi:hypothetical protein N7457_004937, partial [Penicillium paradoxum]|uniref:uncharacterized protein n=1 Tax=Penicillium paradoxum TaxID=176176 RepID=UPI002548198C
ILLYKKRFYELLRRIVTTARYNIKKFYKRRLLGELLAKLKELSNDKKLLATKKLNYRKALI